MPFLTAVQMQNLWAGSCHVTSISFIFKYSFLIWCIQYFFFSCLFHFWLVINVVEMYKCSQCCSNLGLHWLLLRVLWHPLGVPLYLRIASTPKILVMSPHFIGKLCYWSTFQQAGLILQFGLIFFSSKYVWLICLFKTCLIVWLLVCLA